MHPLHISKVAFGCATLQGLARRQARRREGDRVPITTRFRPKRADELIGGSIYWIIKHRIVARQTIIGFAESDGDRRTVIHLDPNLVPVQAAPKRSHQGWRYLEANDAPMDLGDGDDGSLALPAILAQRLASLALI